MLLYPMLWVKNMNFFYYLTTYILFEFVYTSRMKLNHKTHKIVIDELDRVHAGGRKEDVSEETRNVIEKLTGKPIEADSMGFCVKKSYQHHNQI